MPVVELRASAATKKVWPFNDQTHLCEEHHVELVRAVAVAGDRRFYVLPAYEIKTFFRITVIFLGYNREFSGHSCYHTFIPMLRLDPENAPATRHERPLVQVARVEVDAVTTEILQIWKKIQFGIIYIFKTTARHICNICNLANRGTKLHACFCVFLSSVHPVQW